MLINQSFKPILLILVSGFFCWQQPSTMLAAKKAQKQTVLKEYVVVTADKNSVLERLNLLFDKLKLFANYPKNLKELQEQTNVLEDSLRKKLTEMKDSSYIISGVRDEVANARNEIPTQETNVKAKQIFDKIVDFWNSANGEMEKIEKASKEFSNLNDQIKLKINEIEKILEEGNAEINDIKDELEKIAKIEEEIAGKNERDISEQISNLFDSKASSQSVNSEGKTPEKAHEKSPKNESLDEPAPKVLSFWQSIDVLGKILLNFISIAWNGAKDLFVRLFVVKTDNQEIQATLSSDQKAKTDLSASTKSIEKLNASEALEQNSTTPAQDKEAIKYKEGLISSLVLLKNAVFGIVNNGYQYLKKLYSSMQSKKQADEVIEQQSIPQDKTAPAEQKPQEAKVEQKIADQPKPKESTEKPGQAVVLNDKKIEQPKTFKLKLGSSTENPDKPKAEPAK